MIVASLMGGLGNQMFQYAAARTLSVRWDEPLRLDTSWFATDFTNAGVTPRQVGISDFRITGELTVSPFASARLDRVRARMRRELVIADHRCSPQRFARVPHLRHTHLVGYWQDRRYFEESSQTIRDEFVLAAPLSREALVWHDSAVSSGAVGVHVRRGDYVTLASATAHHGVLDSSYYLAAVEEIHRHSDRSEVFVFSDDPEWCAEHLKGPLGATIVSGGLRDIEELMIMSACRHHVLANSSFSWWAAWLGYHEEQMVVAPKRWTADGKPPPAPPMHWQLL